MVDRKGKPPAITPPSPSEPQPHVDTSPDSSRVTARLPSGDSVEVLLHGATVISWKSNGQENVWLSEKAVLDGSKAVRGGIPIVFPVFGPPPPNHATSNLPQHGFARNSRWEFLGKSTSEAGGTEDGDNSVKLDFGLYGNSLDAKSRKAWPCEFGLIYSVTLGKGRLETMMNVRNEGNAPFDFQLLFHTYLRLKDITQTTVTGLVGTSYIDKVLNGKMQIESSSGLRISSETDRVYTSIKQSTTSVLEADKSRFDVVRDNLEDTVIWNPWREKAAGISDFAPKEGYKNMLCVEAGSVNAWQRLEGGDAYEAGQVIKSYS